MSDRVQAPNTPETPTKPVQVTGGETKPPPKSDTSDPAPNEASGGMAGQGGGASEGRREGGMIGEG